MAEKTNATETLDTIREGGIRLVMLSIQRLTEAHDALSEGRFDKALTRCQEAQGAIAQLASAQSSLGMYGRDIFLIRASDVEEGMNLCQIGIVAEKSVEDAPSPSFDQAQIVTLTIVDGEHPLQFDGEKQLLAWHPKVD